MDFVDNMCIAIWVIAPIFSIDTFISPANSIFKGKPIRRSIACVSEMRDGTNARVCPVDVFLRFLSGGQNRSI